MSIGCPNCPKAPHQIASSSLRICSSRTSPSSIRSSRSCHGYEPLASAVRSPLPCPHSSLLLIFILLLSSLEKRLVQTAAQPRDTATRCAFSLSLSLSPSLIWVSALFRCCILVCSFHGFVPQCDRLGRTNGLACHVCNYMCVHLR